MEGSASSEPTELGRFLHGHPSEDSVPSEAQETEVSRFEKSFPPGDQGNSGPPADTGSFGRNSGPGPPGRAPPTEDDGTSYLSEILQLVRGILSSWQLTLRVVVLVAAIAGGLVSILLALQLRADKWGYVTTIAIGTYVLAERLRKRRRRKKSSGS